MQYRTLLFVSVSLLIGTSLASAGNIYKVTSKDGEKTITYEVRFGGGRLRETFTAFDPETKTFVYLEWDRKGKPPTPARVHSQKGVMPGWNDEPVTVQSPGGRRYYSR